MYQQPTVIVTVTAPDGTVTKYNSMRLAADAIGISYNHMRVIKAQKGKSTKGHKVSFG